MAVNTQSRVQTVVVAIVVRFSRVSQQNVTLSFKSKSSTASVALKRCSKDVRCHVVPIHTVRAYSFRIFGSIVCSNNCLTFLTSPFWVERAQFWSVLVVNFLPVRLVVVYGLGPGLHSCWLIKPQLYPCVFVWWFFCVWWCRDSWLSMWCCISAFMI